MGILSGVAYDLLAYGRFGDIAKHAGLAAIIAALFIGFARSRDLYKLSELLNLKLQIRRVAMKWVAIFLFITTAAFTMKVGDQFSRGATILFAASGLATLILARVVWRIVLADGLAVRKVSGRNIVLIEEQGAAENSGLVESLTRHGMQLAQHFMLPANQGDLQRRQKVIAQAIASVRGSAIEEIVVGANPDHWSELNHLLAELRVLPIPVNFIPVGPLSELFKLSSHTIGDTVTIELQRGPQTTFEQLAKRAIDIVIAGSMSILFLPLFLMTAIAVKLDSPGPIIFRQRRCGFNGIPFQILKFRTMTVMEDGETIVQAKPNDPRVTHIGRLLRRTCIDELPQLFNVLQGSMSIVGPRPHAMAHDNQFDQMVAKYAYRHHVKPGLTGWAQVNGFRGQTRTFDDVEQRVKFDLWYIDNWSFAVDFKIMMMTAFEIMRGEVAR